MKSLFSADRCVGPHWFIKAALVAAPRLRRDTDIMRGVVGNPRRAHVFTIDQSRFGEPPIKKPGSIVRLPSRPSPSVKPGRDDRGEGLVGAGPRRHVRLGAI